MVFGVTDIEIDTPFLSLLHPNAPRTLADVADVSWHNLYKASAMITTMPTLAHEVNYISHRSVCVCRVQHLPIVVNNNN